MSKLKLPDVTLVCVETREHELANMAVNDCIDAAEFGDVLILTDKPHKFDADAIFHEVPDWPEKVGWSRSWWYDVPMLLRTRQTLNIQWDSWIWDAGKWDDAFLEYDYVGAPWWYQDNKNVGNGGFSMVSTRLKRFLLKNRGQFPCNTDVDDDLLCRKYRPALEHHGFRWAPESIAARFSWEGCGKKEPTKDTHFGFHAMFNWSLVLDHDGLVERFRVAARSPHLTNPDNPRLRTAMEANPAAAREVIFELEPSLKRQEN